MTKYIAKYNKAEIMRNAHKFYRDGRMGTFAECLKKAWQNAKTVKATVDKIGMEARTYAGWLALGYEVIHGEKSVAQCIVNSVRYASKTIETLSFFSVAQICEKGMQADKA